MKIYQIVSSIAKDLGGPSYTVPSLCSYMHKLGANVELNIIDKEENRTFEFSVRKHEKLFPAKLGVSPGLNNYLKNIVKSGDILHTHGLWMMPNIYPYRISKLTNSKLVLSPRGMLSSWSLNRSRYAKKIVGFLGQNEAFFNSDCIHVTAESELNDVRNFGYRGPVAIIPNGIDIPKTPITINDKVSSGSRKKIIFISRIHPKKGIELLLDAWNSIYRLHTDWELQICGPGELAYIDKIKKRINRMSKANVSYIPPVFNEDKSKFYNSASLFVLPTYNENFGVVVAEALSYGIPVIVSKGAPWKGVVDNNCGWWIDNNVDELINTLNSALKLSSMELYDMGSNGRAWVEKDFSWDTISQNMLSMYDWLNGENEKPAFVYNY